MMNNPYIKTLVWFVGIISAVIGVVLAADDRYAHASDVAKQTATLAAQIEYSADKNSKRYIEDQLFKLEQIPPNKQSDADRALMAKYKRDLRSLNDNWNQRGMPLR